jgi:hypothetical protein
MNDLHNQESPKGMKKGLIHFGANYLKNRLDEVC